MCCLILLMNLMSFADHLKLQTLQPLCILLGTQAQTNSNMHNFILIFTFSILDLFCKFCPKINLAFWCAWLISRYFSRRDFPCYYIYLGNGKWWCSLFNRSVEQLGLIYKRYIGDGDSKSYSTVCGSYPYGPTEFIK